MQNRGEVAVPRDHPEASADGKFLSRAMQLPNAMFGTHGDKLDIPAGGASLLQDKRRSQFHVHRLAASINNGPIRGGAADDRRQNQKSVAKAGDAAAMAIKGIHEDGSPRLHFRDARLRCGNVQRSGSATRDNRTGESVLNQQVMRAGQQSQRLAYRPRLFGLIFQEQEMPLVSHDSGKLQPRQSGDLPRERQCRLSRLHADAMHADVDFQDRANSQARCRHRPADRLGLGDAVHAENRVGNAPQFHQATNFFRPGQHIGNEQIANPRGCEDFRLAEFGARQTAGSRGQQLATYLHRLVALGMGAPANLVLAADCSDLGDVGFQGVQIDAESWSIELILRQADERHGGLSGGEFAGNNVDSYNMQLTSNRPADTRLMPTNITWRTSFSASALHAAEMLARGNKLAESRLAEAIAVPAALLDQEIMAAQVPAARFWRHLVALAASIESNRELALAALVKTVGRGPTADRMEPRLTACIAGVESAFGQCLPKLDEELPLRSGPLREQWEARGPGLLTMIGGLTEQILLAEEAQVVVVHPALGGGGEAYLPGNQVRLEGMLANPHPDLPEVVRLAWLLSQLQLDLPAISENIHADRLPHIAGFAMLPVVLKAAEEVELVRFSPELIERAITVWKVRVPPNVSATSVLLQWWETYLESRPPFRVALAALDQMFG